MHAYGRYRRSRRTMLRVTLYKEEARGARQRAAERAGSVRARLHEGVTVAALRREKGKGSFAARSHESPTRGSKLAAVH